MLWIFTELCTLLCDGAVRLDCGFISFTADHSKKTCKDGFLQIRMLLQLNMYTNIM